MTELVERMKPKGDVQVQTERPMNPIGILQDDGVEAMEDILIMRLASEYTDDDMMLNNDGTPEQDVHETRTIQFQRNRHAIKTALDAYITKNGKLPSTTTLSKITGFTRPTIEAHLKAGAINLHFRQELSKLQLLSSDLLVKLYHLGLNGDAKAIKMLVDILLAGQKFKSGTTQNFIQINNLRVDNRNLDRLRPKAKAQIEKIIRRELGLNV
jgi:hypothetical protein